MRWLILVGLLLSSAQARELEVNTYAAGGVGFPELVRAEAGMFFGRRISVELVTGVPSEELVTGLPELPDFTNLDIMLGATVTGWLVGYTDGMRPPVNSLLVSGGLRFNVLDPLRLEAEGDRMGLTGEVMAGYGHMNEDLLVVRAQAGLMLFGEAATFTVGPNIVVTVGKAFE